MSLEDAESTYPHSNRHISGLDLRLGLVPAKRAMRARSATRSRVAAAPQDPVRRPVRVERIAWPWTVKPDRNLRTGPGDVRRPAPQAKRQERCSPRPRWSKPLRRSRPPVEVIGPQEDQPLILRDVDERRQVHGDVLRTQASNVAMFRRRKAALARPARGRRCVAVPPRPSPDYLDLPRLIGGDQVVERLDNATRPDVPVPNFPTSAIGPS